MAMYVGFKMIPTAVYGDAREIRETREFRGILLHTVPIYR